jgi:hypothetical protein
MPWVSREWRERIKQRVERVEQQYVGLTKRIDGLSAVLYCEHADVEFVTNDQDSWVVVFGPPWFKRCRKCQKVLESYGSEVEFVAAKIAHEEAIVSRDAKRLKELRK